MKKTMMKVFSVLLLLMCVLSPAAYADSKTFYYVYPIGHGGPEDSDEAVKEVLPSSDFVISGKSPYDVYYNTANAGYAHKAGLATGYGFYVNNENAEQLKININEQEQDDTLTENEFKLLLYSAGLDNKEFTIVQFRNEGYASSSAPLPAIIDLYAQQLNYDNLIISATEGRLLADEKRDFRSALKKDELTTFLSPQSYDNLLGLALTNLNLHMYDYVVNDTIVQHNELKTYLSGMVYIKEQPIQGLNISRFNQSKYSTISEKMAELKSKDFDAYNVEQIVKNAIYDTLYFDLQDQSIKNVLRANLISDEDLDILTQHPDFEYYGDSFNVVEVYETMLDAAFIELEEMLMEGLYDFVEASYFLDQNAVLESKLPQLKEDYMNELLTSLEKDVASNWDTYLSKDEYKAADARILKSYIENDLPNYKEQLEQSSGETEDGEASSANTSDDEEINNTLLFIIIGALLVVLIAVVIVLKSKKKS